MKVVLFCGGFGMRIREYSESIPKPMVKIGYRPILWHVMKYYAHFGHTEFILCLGWKANVIKEYFLNYDECVSNDFVLKQGGKSVEMINSDIDQWTITFVDTGPSACIGERLKAVQPYLDGEEMFLANYTDGLSDVPLPELIDFHQDNQAVASFLSVRPSQSFHAVTAHGSGAVEDVAVIRHTDTWMNGGFFVFSQEFFDYLEDGEELIDEPFRRLIDLNKLYSMKYEGFWSCMDTYKEMQQLDDLYAAGAPPWTLWSNAAAEPPALAYSLKS